MNDTLYAYLQNKKLLRPKMMFAQYGNLNLFARDKGTFQKFKGVFVNTATLSIGCTVM